jgi:hypothetical protein
MGGAIKSILFNEEVADIDISVKADLTDPERSAFAPLSAAANERVYQHAVESITRLARAMGVDASAFLPPARGVTKAFEGLNIDYFGPIRTDRGAIIKRSLFDAVTRKGYFTNTAAGLLRFAIDAEGNIYGDTSALQDLLQGKLTVQGDGTNFGINDVLRVLRIKYQYGLQISNEDEQSLKNAASRYQNQSLPPIVLEVARDQIQKLLTSAVNKESAQQELEALGVSPLIDKSRTAPQSSSPVVEPNYRGTDLKQNAWIQAEGIPEVRDDQGRLLAPNGEPSNLPVELWKLVRTDTFKKWFGDWENHPEGASKIVDKNGEPLVMYHASVEDFTVFRQDRIASRDYRLHGGKPRLQGGAG